MYRGMHWFFVWHMDVHFSRSQSEKVNLLWRANQKMKLLVLHFCADLFPKNLSCSGKLETGISNLLRCSPRFTSPIFINQMKWPCDSSLTNQISQFLFILHMFIAQRQNVSNVDDRTTISENVGASRQRPHDKS
jgi:hypothetical protein